jgi:hypothetical protein
MFERCRNHVSYTPTRSFECAAYHLLCAGGCSTCAALHAAARERVRSDALCDTLRMTGGAGGRALSSCSLCAACKALSGEFDEGARRGDAGERDSGSRYIKRWTTRRRLQIPCPPSSSILAWIPLHFRCHKSFTRIRWIARFGAVAKNWLGVPPLILSAEKPVMTLQRRSIACGH